MKRAVITFLVILTVLMVVAACAPIFDVRPPVPKVTPTYPPTATSSFPTYSPTEDPTAGPSPTPTVVVPTPTRTPFVKPTCPTGTICL